MMMMTMENDVSLSLSLLRYIFHVMIYGEKSAILVFFHPFHSALDFVISAVLICKEEEEVGPGFGCPLHTFPPLVSFFPISGCAISTSLFYFHLRKLCLFSFIGWMKVSCN